MAAAAAPGLAAALADHDRIRKSTDLPLFYGRKDKDVITAQQLMERLNRASVIAGWNDQRKCSEFYLILRDRAIHWWNSLDNEEVPNITNDNWAELQAAFLRAYAPKYTAKSTCNIFVDLQQKTGESVQDYYLRVDDGFRRMCETKPFTIEEQVVAPLLPQGDIGAAGLTVQQALIYKLEGVRQQEKFLLHQLFVAGLKEDIRTKIMEARHLNVRATVDAARELESILADRRSKGHVSAINQDEDRTEDEEHKVTAIRGKDGKFRKENRPSQGNNGNRERRPFTGQCRYCKKTGHLQRFCHERKQKGAPCVDASGVPYKTQYTNTIENENKSQLDEACQQIGSLNF
jgi:hypothetical protein